MLAEGDEVRELAARSKLTVPVLAINALGSFTRDTVTQVAQDVTTVKLDGRATS